MARQAIDLLYGTFALVSFFVCSIGALLGAAVLPGLSRRRRWVSATARCWFTIAGIRVTRSGFCNIPPGHCVVVANHASYLDGVILQAYLPPRFSYVIKGEMQNVPLASLLLRRIGSRFVDRFVATNSTRDARNLLKAASAGESLGVFPEGTFRPEVGLHKFRAGAFAAAIKGRLPVVPVVIRGSRHILPARRILPRRGPLAIDALPAMLPDGPEFASSKVLAQAARQRLLTVLEEPDLARHGEPAPAAAPESGLQSVNPCE
jgi:1-acyl-sn-glycerol-3-phosphate acyltransferase